MGDEQRRSQAPDDTLQAEARGPDDGRPEILEVGRLAGDGHPRAIHRRAFLKESLAAGLGLSSLSGLMAACGKASGPSGYESWKSGACMQEVACSHRGEVYAAAYGPDGTRIASAGSDAKVKIWSAASGDVLLTYSGHAVAVKALAFSRDGVRIVSGDLGGAIQIWNATTGALLAGCSHLGLQAVAFSLDGTRVASAGDTTVKTWDAASGTLLLTYTGHSNIVNDVAFSPDGARIASCSSDGTIRIWNASTGAAGATCAHSGVASLAFSQDGSRLVSGGNASAQVWNPATGQSLLTIGGFAWRVAFSPSGAEVATAGTTEIRTWDASTGALRVTIGVTPAFGVVSDVAFSPDGARIASGDGLGMVKAWDASTGALATAFLDAGALLASDTDCSARYGGTGHCTCDTVCYCNLVCGCDQVCTCNGQSGPCTCHFVVVPR